MDPRLGKGENRKRCEYAPLSGEVTVVLISSDPFGGDGCARNRCTGLFRQTHDPAGPVPYSDQTVAIPLLDQLGLRGYCSAA